MNFEFFGQFSAVKRLFQKNVAISGRLIFLEDEQHWQLKL